MNHALYISHYPQGRDATVDYPDVDLRFVNDTGHWLFRTFVGPTRSRSPVRDADRPQGREHDHPLVAHGKPPVKKTVDPT